MRLEFIDELEAFAAHAWPLLIADEANHTLLLGALQGARRARESGTPDPGTTPWRSAIARDGDRVVAAAFRSRDNWLVSTGPVGALQAIGTVLRGGSFDGIVGPEPSARACAAAYGEPMHVHITMPLMKLDGMPQAGPNSPPGELVAMSADISPQHWQLVLAWSLAFHDEARLAGPRERVEPDLRARLTRATLYLWMDQHGTPRSMVGAAAIAPSAARIAPVYTAPALRGQGFARAAVVAACRLMLDGGARSVFLFTDAANSTSNALYQKIGFVPIGQHVHLTVART